MKDSSKKYLFLGSSPSDNVSVRKSYEIKNVYSDLDKIQLNDNHEVSVSMKRKIEIWKTLKYKDGVLYYKKTGEIYKGSEIKKIVCCEQNLRYHGYIKDGKVNGKGMHYHNFSQNLKYMGDLVDGTPEGKGKKYNQEGYVEYEGGFDAGLYEGEGKLYYSNGKIAYEGYFQNGKCNRYGKYYNRDGQLRYQGEFYNNKFDGQGVFYEKNGKQYNGLFENDKYNGKRFLSKRWNFYQLF